MSCGNRILEIEGGSGYMYIGSQRPSHLGGSAASFLGKF